WATANVDFTVRADEDLDREKATLVEAAEKMNKEEPWDELLWSPAEVLGLDQVRLVSMAARVAAQSMPGNARSVERELRWRIKRAFDAAGIRIVGGATTPEDPAPGPDPAASVAPPSAYASSVSPQSVAASPLTPPSTTK